MVHKRNKRNKRKRLKAFAVNPEQNDFGRIRRGSPKKQMKFKAKRILLRGSSEVLYFALEMYTTHVSSLRLHMFFVKLMSLPRKVRFRVTGQTRVDWGVDCPTKVEVTKHFMEYQFSFVLSVDLANE